VAAVAERQHAMVALAQLRRAGLGQGAIEHRVRSGRLRPYHRGVYLVGPAVPPLGPEAAALLACPGAVLSHRTAAAIWGLVDRDPETVDVLSTKQRRPRPGMRVHRTQALERREVRIREGLVLTDPFRSLTDVAHVLTPENLQKATSEALFRRLISDAQLRSIIGGAGPTARHHAERRLQQLIRKARLPEPQTNVWVHGFEVDFSWPDRRLAVELDGFQAHGHRLAFERDRRRDLALEAHGITTVRVTYRQVEDEPEALVASLSRLVTCACG
jgi:very-short-patch-repair endonuclease